MNLENKIEAQRKRMEQEKNKLDMLMKKSKMEQRKADNHRKIVVGANFETFLNEPRRYSEEQTRRIMQVAFATREVKNCMEQIERELARAEEKMPDTSINEEADEGESEEESAKIKAAEKRMAEIAVLRTHIINYAKTRDTYVAYRKAGYSKKFREAHEEEILLHQAAKNVFDDMGVKKLPKVKELQAEYARLLEEKKMTYAEYRRSREEMRELLAAKANVDRLLNLEAEHDTEREKDHEQR